MREKWMQASNLENIPLHQAAIAAVSLMLALVLIN